jgi:LmbE family N-acetylglucosaminyl deacetylase
MGTAVFFHAHPDDEVLSTGGSMARAVDEGHRVVLVVATNGEHGESPEDLSDGETLVDRRRTETERSAAVLGVQRVVWLGYRDSGMHGWEQNHDPESFLRATLEEAAGRLAAVLDEERADLVVTYDWHGIYGHPDHVQVHRVGHRAAELAGTRLLEATMNRDAMVAMMAEGAVPEAADTEREEWDPNSPMDDGNPFGTPEAELHLAVDVSSVVRRKWQAIACHASQVTDVGAFLAMPDDVFDRSFATEWYIDPGAPSGMRAGWIFDDVDDDDDP